MQDLKPAPQDYLKAIHRIVDAAGRGRRANTKAIATSLGVSLPSVSAMLDRLAMEGLVDHVPYGGATLTPRGRQAALRVIRRHRLVELYLTRFLSLGWEEVHDEAERLEHVLSDRLEQAIDAALDHPEFDPHGDPIPGPDGTVDAGSRRTLWSLEDADVSTVSRVRDDDPDLLRHLWKIGIVPGARLEGVRHESGGAVRVTVARRQRLVGREAAERVFVVLGAPTRSRPVRRRRG